MYFRQLVDPVLGCASYILGCTSSAKAIVVDPLQALGADEYILEAADHGLDIAYVMDTHVHADHRSVARALAEKTGAQLMLSHNTPASFPFNAVSDGDELELGEVAVTLWETPGHTPDSMSLLVRDRTRSDSEPWLVLTGDSLFVGDVARPDLFIGEAGEAEIAKQAGALYETIGRLMTLSDHVEVYPGHFGASACGGAFMNVKASSTVGFERRFNVALQNKDLPSFSEFVLGHLKPQPSDYKAVKRANLNQEPPGEDGRPLSASEVAAADARKDTVLVDVRPEKAFVGAHLQGSRNAPFRRGILAKQLPSDLDRTGAQLVVVAKLPAVAADAARQLESAGFAIAGTFSGEPSGWRAAGLSVRGVEEWEVERLAREMAAGAAPTVVDVRDPDEWEEGHIEGAVLLPLDEIDERIGELDPRSPCALICASGTRSARAALALAERGFERPINVIGGMQAWQAGDRPVAHGA